MDKCKFCGAEENPTSSDPTDHCEWVGKYSKKLTGVRSIYCYERELASLRADLEAKDKLLREAVLMLKRWVDNSLSEEYGIELLTSSKPHPRSETIAFLNLPEIKKLEEE
jgi:hypothetical protein